MSRWIATAAAICLIAAAIYTTPAQTGSNAQSSASALPSSAAAKPSPKTTIDPKAMALLAKVEERMKSVNTLSARWTWMQRYVEQSYTYHDASSGTIRVMRPNFCYVSRWAYKRTEDGRGWTRNYLEDLNVTDGKTVWVWTAYNGVIIKSPADPLGRHINVAEMSPIYGFFNPKQSFAEQAVLSRNSGLLRMLRYVGKAQEHGQTYQLVRWTRLIYTHALGATGKPVLTGLVTQTDDLYIGSDFLIHRDVSSGSNGQVDDIKLDDLHLNIPIQATAFAFKKPPYPPRPIPQQQPDSN